MSCYIVDNEKRELNYFDMGITANEVKKALSARLNVIELLPSWINSNGEITAVGLLAEKTKYGFFNHQNDRLIKVEDPYFRVPDNCSVYQVGYKTDELYLLANNHLIRIRNVKNFYPEKEGFKHRQARLNRQREDEESKKRLEKEALIKKQNEELKQKKLDRLLASIKD